MISNKLTASALAVAAVVGTTSVASAASISAVDVNVDTELSLVIDVSGSVDDTEFNQQITGYVNAFRDADVINAIMNGNIGAIAVNAIAFASSAAEKVGYTLINDAASSNAFADLMEGFSRGGVGGLTDIADGINAGAASFAGNGFNGARQVIDVSGDGRDNTGPSVTAARNAACAGGVDAINGIAIGSTSLTTYYENNVICGTGSFAFTATGFDTFGDGIKQKLISEITTPTNPIPLPAAGWLLIAGLGGLGMMKRRKA